MATNQEKLDALAKNTFTKGDGAYQNKFIENGFSKRDGAYTNGIIGDGNRQGAAILAAVNQLKEAAGLAATRADVSALGGKVDALDGLLRSREEGAPVDAAAVAAQILELLPDDIADDVVEALARRLTPEGA